MGKLAIDALENELALSPYARFLKKHGMYSAALFYKNLNETLQRRGARASRFHFENMQVPNYERGQVLFANHPAQIMWGHQNDDINGYGCQIDFMGQCSLDGSRFEKLREVATTPQEQHIISTIWQNAANMYVIPISRRFLHGGTHNIVDFEYVLKHGLGGYLTKIEKRLQGALEAEERQFLEGMIDVLEGMHYYVTCYTTQLEEASGQNPADEDLKRLLEAVRHVPFAPARSFYEAFITMNALMFLSECYEPGRIDELLRPYYEADLACGKTSRDEAYRLIRALLEDIDKRIGHPGATHVTIGGTNLAGEGAYSELTQVVVEAIGGLRTPNVTLRVREDMPDELWTACLDNIGKGYGQPALVNEKLFLEGLMAQYNIPFEDAINYAFAGCSEVLIQGKTTCDSTWVAYNMLDIFEHTFYNEFLESESFESFYEAYKRDLKVTLHDLRDQINLWQHTHGLHTPHPVMTLLTGDCVDQCKSFLGGGSKYNFDSTDIYGSTNAINALYSIKQFYEGAFGQLSKEAFLDCFAQDYKGYEDVLATCQNITKFGNYNEELEELAHEVMGLTFETIKTLKGYRGDAAYMPSIIGWVSWKTCGVHVGATPDGRRVSESLADSCGPMQGTDTEGPTSTMGAALAIPQEDCVGTCVLNLRLDGKHFESDEARDKVRVLFETYFAEGGSQLQLNVVDKKALEEALKEPEKHRDIIVRVGGFSDQFVALEKKLQTEIMKRTAH
ncbi:MAG: pyruvate formate lyase family protein [Cellulosilyticaceae bacterium]